MYVYYTLCDDDDDEEGDDEGSPLFSIVKHEAVSRVPFS